MAETSLCIVEPTVIESGPGFSDGQRRTASALMAAESYPVLTSTHARESVKRGKQSLSGDKESYLRKLVDIESVEAWEALFRQRL